MEQIRVCVLDYGSGNVGSVYNLVSSLTTDVQVSNELEAVQRATHLILPGVGAFGASMNKILERLPVEELEIEVLERAKPFLGICVGLQVLADKGYEFGEYSGLGWLPGMVTRLETNNLPLPHMGWNDIHVERASALLDSPDAGPDFYFVHSYVIEPQQREHIVATTCYGTEFASIVNKDNIHGVQFHPEKSQKAGRRLLQNFLNLRG